MPIEGAPWLSPKRAAVASGASGSSAPEAASVPVTMKPPVPPVSRAASPAPAIPSAIATLVVAPPAHASSPLVPAPQTPAPVKDAVDPTLAAAVHPVVTPGSLPAVVVPPASAVSAAPTLADGLAQPAVSATTDGQIPATTAGADLLPLPLTSQQAPPVQSHPDPPPCPQSPDRRLSRPHSPSLCDERDVIVTVSGPLVIPD
ncbi:unnamed protein product [Closterium sp. NIES-54]